MTVAVCVRCGAIKHGAFNYCKACGMRPETETDAAYSLALTDHYFSAAVLNKISTDMLSGKPRPHLSTEQEQHFHEAARVYLDKFGKALNLPSIVAVDPEILAQATRSMHTNYGDVSDLPFELVNALANAHYRAHELARVPMQSTPEAFERVAKRMARYGPAVKHAPAMVESVRDARSSPEAFQFHCRFDDRHTKIWNGP